MNPDIPLRPQPIGYFHFPAGFLLLPPAPEADAPLALLLSGRIPAALPAAWAFFGHALAGNASAALSALASETAPWALYNRYVLSGEPALLSQLEATAPPALRELAHLVAFTLGQRDQLGPWQALDGEFLAVARMTEAAAHLEAEREPAALAQLDLALAPELSLRQQSPVLAAHLLLQRAQLSRATQAPPDAIRRDFEEVLLLAKDCDIPGFRAQAHLDLGSFLHETSQGQRGILELAAQHYQQALRQGFSLDQNPEMYAWTQQQLALAYLAMPLRAATDQLRMGIAIQGLREALRVYTQERYPDLWATATLNLANALQYLPSSHPKENLIQAVNLYEDLLAVRNRAFDPLGFARLLFNQANALAHLGIFQPALEKLNESHKLFHWHGEELLARQALDQLERINARLAPTEEVLNASA